MPYRVLVNVGLLCAMGSSCLLAGVAMHAFAQVMWVEDQMSDPADPVLSYVVQTPPVLAAAMIAARVVLLTSVVSVIFGFVHAARGRPNDATGGRALVGPAVLVVLGAAVTTVLPVVGTPVLFAGALWYVLKSSAG